jgi:zinc transporter 1/2/3
MFFFFIIYFFFFNIKEEMEAVDTAKIISMVLLCIIPLILGLVPIWIARKMHWNEGRGQTMSQLAKNVLSGLLCFGAGVLMATALTHLLPDIIEGVDGLMDSGILNSSLPLGEIFFSMGFFLVYLVEELVHMIADPHAHSKTDVSIHRSVGVRECSISREGQPVPPCGNGGSDDDVECRRNTICDSDDCNGEQEFCDSPSTISTSGTPPVAMQSISSDSVKQTEAELSRRISFDDHGHSHHDHHHHHSHAPVDDGDNVLPSVRGLLVIVGLSLHEILEGVAVGLQTTEGDVWNLFAAIASHKFVIAFCVGMEMATNGVRVSLHIFYIITLSVVTSIGNGKCLRFVFLSNFSRNDLHSI